MSTTPDLSAYVVPISPEIDRARRHDIGSILERSAVKFPDKTAIVHGDVRRTFRELGDDANRVAHALIERGITAGQRVVILSRNSYEFVVCYFALTRVGAISVPVNFNLTADEVAYVLGDATPTAVIVQDALCEVMEAAIGIAGTSPDLRIVVGERAEWEPFDALRTHEDTSTVVSSLGDDDPLQLLYTSGTTSRPKGAIMSSRNLISQYVSDIIDGEYHHDDIELHALPLYHCAALHDFLTPDIYLGATSVIIDTPTPANIIEMVRKEGITKMFCPPTVWIGLLRSPEFDPAALSTLRKGYYGAAIMPVPVLKELQEKLPQIRLFNYYGQTELAPNATVLSPEDQIRKAGTAGRASVNVLTRLHDDSDQPIPVGEIGEIVHRSPHLMRGYWGKPDATDEAFKGGWFHSGDLGVMDDEGYLTVVDRKKDMIISGGENVASREVEDALYAHDDVAEVAVFGVPHEYWIEAVAAAVVLRPEATAESDSLLAFAKERLAGFKIPKYVVVVDELPKNPSGKILKRELREQYADLSSADAG